MCGRKNQLDKRYFLHARKMMPAGRDNKLIIFEGAKAVQNDWMILPFNKAWFTVVGSVVQRYNISCIWSQAFFIKAI